MAVLTLPSAASRCSVRANQTKWGRDAQTSGPVAPKAVTFGALGTVSASSASRRRCSLTPPTTTSRALEATLYRVGRVLLNSCIDHSWVCPLAGTPSKSQSTALSHAGSAGDTRNAKRLIVFPDIRNVLASASVPSTWTSVAGPPGSRDATARDNQFKQGSHSDRGYLTASANVAGLSPPTGSASWWSPPVSQQSREVRSDLTASPIR
jgi:hypothetical protein